MCREFAGFRGLRAEGPERVPKASPSTTFWGRSLMIFERKVSQLQLSLTAQDPSTGRFFKKAKYVPIPCQHKISLARVSLWTSKLEPKQPNNCVEGDFPATVALCILWAYFIT